MPFKSETEQTDRNNGIATSKCVKVRTMSLLCDMKVTSCDRIFLLSNKIDLTGVLCCVTLFEHLRQSSQSMTNFQHVTSQP